MEDDRATQNPADEADRDGNVASFTEDHVRPKPQEDQERFKAREWKEQRKEEAIALGCVDRKTRDTVCLQEQTILFPSRTCEKTACVLMLSLHRIPDCD